MKMATATVIFIAATAAASLAPLGAAAAQPSDQVECKLGGEKQNFSITKPGGKLQVTCVQEGSSEGTGQPPQICVDETCSAPNDSHLQLACPGGKATPESRSKSSLVITCPQLPNTTTSILILCRSSNLNKKDKRCAVQLTVSAPPPEGPQVCAAEDTTVTLAIRGEGAQTQFACSTDTKLTTLNPTEPNKVYKEDCSAEEDLKDLKLTKGGEYYTLAAIKKPRSRKLCYLCKAPSGNARTGEQCKILIDVSAGPGRPEPPALGLALCCALALLHLI